MKFAASVVVKVISDAKSWLVLTYTPANKSFGSLLKRSLSLLEVHLPHPLPILLMVVVMMVRYRISSHLNLKRFSILALILNLATVCTTVLGSLLVLLIYLLFSFHRRLSVMPYHSLGLVSMMALYLCPITLSMPKML